MRREPTLASSLAGRMAAWCVSLLASAPRGPALHVTASSLRRPLQLRTALALPQPTASWQQVYFFILRSRADISSLFLLARMWVPSCSTLPQGMRQGQPKVPLCQCAGRALCAPGAAEQHQRTSCPGLAPSSPASPAAHPHTPAAAPHAGHPPATSTLKKGKTHTQHQLSPSACRP